MTLSEMLKALKQMGTWIEWERDSLEDFHKYAQKFGGSPGSNVFDFAFKDALAHRGMTLEQFRAEMRPSQPPAQKEQP